MIEIIQNSVYRIETFIYETPIRVIVAVVAGIACRIFRHQLAFPLLTIACMATLTRIAAQIIEMSSFQLSIKMNSHMQDINSAYGSFYYPVLAITLTTYMIIPLIGRTLAFCLGVYQGMITEIQILQLKYNARLDHNGANEELPKEWMRGF